MRAISAFAVPIDVEEARATARHWLAIVTAAVQAVLAAAALSNS